MHRHPAARPHLWVSLRRVVSLHLSPAETLCFELPAAALVHIAASARMTPHQGHTYQQTGQPSACGSVSARCVHAAVAVLTSVSASKSQSRLCEEVLKFMLGGCSGEGEAELEMKSRT